MSANLLFTPNNFNLQANSLVVVTPLQLPSFTTSQISSLPTTAGLAVYNSTTGTLNFANGSAWLAVTHA